MFPVRISGAGPGFIGGNRGEGAAGRRAAPQHPPLEDARVLAPHGNEVAVVVGEADVGDVAAVTGVDVAWSLWKNGDVRVERRGEKFRNHAV